MDISLSFTSEKLTKKFKSTFDLVNYAIALAENRIKTGHISNTIDRDNVVMTILNDIEEGKDRFEPIPVPQINVETVRLERLPRLENHFDSEKSEMQKDRKKGKKRVILDDDED